MMITEERYQEKCKEMEREWKRYTTRDLLNELQTKLRGCNLERCLACGNTDALVNVLREHFDTDILDPALEPQRKEYGSILNNEPSKPLQGGD
jgi:hypothetical protein